MEILCVKEVLTDFLTLLNKMGQDFCDIQNLYFLVRNISLRICLWKCYPLTTFLTNTAVCPINLVKFLYRDTQKWIRLLGHTGNLNPVETISIGLKYFFSSSAFSYIQYTNVWINLDTLRVQDSSYLE